MKILLAHCFYRSSAPSGEDNVYRNEKALLVDNGHEVYTYEKHNDDIANTNIFEKIPLAKNTVWSHKAAREITGVLDEVQPDVVHFHNTFPQMSPSVFQACKNHGVAVVQTLHNFRYICASALLQRAGEPCEKCIGSRVVHALRHSCYRNSLIATLPLAANIALSHHNGNFFKNVDRYITLTAFAQSRFLADGFPKQRLAIKPNFIPDPGCSATKVGDYAIYVGRLTQEKGIASLVEAWKNVDDIPLKIVGDGELATQLASASKTHKLPISFLGQKKKDEVINLIKQARFVIVPSECYEGFPLAVIEAYACGKPVIASAIGSLNEIVVEGITGRKAPAQDARALSKVVSELWRDPALLNRMSNAARQMYEEHFTPKKNLDALLDIYNEAIHHSSSVII